jgi:quinolinate synthase
VISENVIKKINDFKKKENAIILAHTYQLPEIQEIADFVGDSLELSMKVKESDAKLVVFCGVRFMAETAKLISPEKTVLLPAEYAGCPMANMVTAEQLTEYKKEHPNTKIVCYINSTAEVKAQCDMCCTSSNAVKVVQSFPMEQDILFVPDQNLGAYVKGQLNKENMSLWPGHCYVHSNIHEEDVLNLKLQHHDAVIMAHPECKAEVLKHADYILSTSNMVRKVKEIQANEFIIVTEEGILHQLRKQYPDKTFYSLKKAICLNMKKTTLEVLLDAIENKKHEVVLSEDVISKAKVCVYNMLNL